MRRVWTLAALLVAPLAAPAGHCGLCGYPAAAVAPEQCMPPVFASRVAYQPVSEIVNEVAYRPVTRTTYQSVTDTAYRTVYDQQVEAVAHRRSERATRYRSSQ